MDSPLIAMLFAEELMKTFLELNNLQKPSGYSVIPHQGEYLKSRLTPQITEAVIALLKEREETIDECYEKLIELDINDKDNFRLEICVTMVCTFKSGYDHETFLNFCALLVGVSIRYAEDQNNFDIADASAQVLSYVLNFYIYMLIFDPCTSWFQLSLHAQRLRRKLSPPVTD